MESRAFGSGGTKSPWQGQGGQADMDRQQDDSFNPRLRQEHPLFPKAIQKGKQEDLFAQQQQQKGKQEDLFAQQPQRGKQEDFLAQQPQKGKQEDLFAQQQRGNKEDFPGQKGKQNDSFPQQHQREKQEDPHKGEYRRTGTSGPTERIERAASNTFGDFLSGNVPRDPPATSYPQYVRVAGDVELSAIPGHDVIHNPAMHTVVKMVTMLNFMKVELGETKTLRSKEQWRAAGAEFVGTFLFVFLGCGSVVASGMLFAEMTPSRLIAIALAHGMAICCLAAAAGAISGGHLNPAVTLAFVVAGKENLVRAGLYASAQILGGVFGALFLQFATPEYLRGSLGSHDISMYIYTSQGFLMEMVLTFALVIVIFGVAVDRRGPGVIAPIPIGFVVSVDHLVGVPYTGASMNPARSFGPALVSGYFGSAHLVYWVAPCLGATAAAALYRYTILQPAQNAAQPPPIPAPR